MDANECGTNHLDADVRLPPRKRLLAGLKKQSCSETIAEEKAAIAAKAVAAAKSALDKVASISEETSSKDKHHKKNKLKKHVPVQLLYKKHQPVESCGTDEELARKLHRAINSSPRINRNSPGSDSKSHKHKKLKVSPPSEKSGVANEGGMDCEGSNEEPFTVKLDDRVSKFTKPDEMEVDSGEAESSQSKVKTFTPSDDVCTNGRKRGRIKQKKLPLSLCSSKDQSNPKEDLILTNSLLSRGRTDKSTARHVSLLSLETPAENVTPMEVAQTWKCQDFKVSQCLNQDKAVQS
uniref:Uncharacterized protein n=1 Tax=Chenopodium quinoa TaxID=63459 RepID=A0A803KSP4_CHEQI